MMKRVWALLLLLGVLFLSACGGAADNTPSGKNDGGAQSNAGKTEVPTDAPRFRLESKFTDWKGEFAVTYAAALRYEYLHGIHTNVVVEIVNTGSNPIVMSGMGKYTLMDSEGVQADPMFFDKSFPAVIYPGETGYLAGYTNLFDEWDVETNLQIATVFDSEPMTQFKEAEAKAYYRYFDTAEEEVSLSENGNIRVTGKVTNNSGTDAECIYVSAVLFDADNKPLHVVQDIVDAVKVGETVDFEASATTQYQIAKEDVARWEIVAYYYN